MAPSGIVQGLLIELAKEEAALLAAHAEYQRVQTAFNVALRKYIGVRDVTATANYRSSPYFKWVEWPTQAEKLVPAAKRGQFRFAGKSVADAAIELLNESDEWLSLGHILTRLSRGGLHTNLRTINASLVNSNRVERDDKDGTYHAKEEDEEEGPDDDE